MFRIWTIAFLCTFVLPTGTWAQPTGFLKDGFYNDFDSQGTLVRTTEYKSGRPNGRIRSFYDDGRIRNMGTNLNGRLEGMMQGYYPDGKLQFKGFYRAGKMHGVAYSYYP